MHRNVWFGGLCAVLLGFAAFWYFRTEAPQAVTIRDNESIAVPEEAPNLQALPATSPAGSALAKPIVLLPGMDSLANGLADEQGSVAADLEIVNSLFSAYHRVFGGMPAGADNREIVRLLSGHNDRGVAVLPGTNPKIDKQGELLDRFGTPYFFHQQSKDLMEIRSAGPDGILWTPDDLTFE